MTNNHFNHVSRAPLKVALIANSTTPGGAESYLYRLYEGLSNQGLVDVTLIGQLPDWSSSLKSVAVAVGPKLTRRKPIIAQTRGVLSNAQKIKKALDEGSYDLIHMQYFREKLVLPGVFTRDTPVLWTEHGPIPPNFPRAGMPLLRKQARRSTVLAVSEAVHTSLSENKISSEIVWNPLPRTGHSRRKHGDSSDYVLYAGRIHENKRIDLILDAARKTPEIRFTIAGEGPLLTNLQQLAPSNVDFLGHVRDLSSLMDRCLAVVVSSGRAAREGSPMIVLEARNAGVPVLMARDCHAAEEAKSLGARLFDPNSDALKGEIIRLGMSVRIDPLTDEQKVLRSEERWLRETYRIMTRVALSSQSV